MARTQRHGRRKVARLLHVFAIVVRALGLLTFGGSILLMLSLELAPVRRWVVRRVDDVLASTFAGKVVIESVDQLGIGGVRGARIRVSDPSGTQVLWVDGASVRVSLVSTLRSILVGKGDMVIDLAEVNLGYVDANLDVDAAGQLRLASAFEPRDKTPSQPSSRRTAIALRRIQLDHAWLHGQPPGAPLVDADIDRLAAKAHIGSEQAVDLAKMDLTTRAMPQNANARLGITASFRAPAPSGQDRAGRVELRGDIGGIPFTAQSSLDGPAVEAVVDVPRITPQMVAGLFPSVTPTEEASVHIDARGHLPDLEASVHAMVGRGIVDLRATLKLSDEKDARATITARNIDAHAVSAAAPASVLGADATLDLHSHPSGDADGTFSFDVLPGAVSGTSVPSAHFGGSIRKTAALDEATTSITGSGVVDEAGARTRLDFDVRQAHGTKAVGFDVATSIPRLEETRLGPGVAGSAELQVRGTITASETTTLDVDADLKASSLARADQRLERAWLRAHVRGAARDPLVDAIFQGSGLSVANMRFATAALTAHGSQHRSDIEVAMRPVDGPKIDGRATIETGASIAVRDASVSFSRDDQRVVIGLASLHSAGGDTRIEGLMVEGLGDPVRASAHESRQGFTVRASTNELDLSRLARLFRLKGVYEGHVALDVDMNVERAAARGHIRLDLVQGQFDRMKNGNAHVEANFDGRSVDAVLHGRLGEIGNVEINRCHIEIDGKGPLVISSWENARGTLALDSEVDLARIRRLLPKGSVPLTDLAGRLRVKGEVSRTAKAAVPDVQLSLETRGLVMSGRGEAEAVDHARVLDTPPWSIEGVDVQLATHVTGETGATEVSAKLHDRQGPLTEFDAHSPSVPYRDWLHDRPPTLERLGALRVAGRIVVPRRELKKFPALLKTQQFSGSIAASAEMDGTLADPIAHLLLEATQFASAVGSGSKPIDAVVNARYESGEAIAAIEVESVRKRLLNGELRVSGRIGDLFRGPDHERMSWRGSTRMTLADFPLDTVGLFSDFQMKGFASGELTLDDLHQDARAQARITFRDLELGRAKFPSGSAHAEFDGKLLHAAMRLDQTDGYVETAAQAGMVWGRDIAPKPTTDVPAFATLKSNRFRAAALLPFVTSALSELDGRIDADARIDVKQGGGPPNMKGSVALSEGVVQLVNLGEPLHSVNAKIVMTPDGLVKVESLTAHGSTGMLDAKATARLNGFDLVGVRANVRIPPRDPLPVDVDGNDIGDVDGDMSVSLDRSADGRVTNVLVDIPRLHTQLPLASTHKVQELGEAKGVRFGYFRRPAQFILLPKDADDFGRDEGASKRGTASRMNVAVHLGDDVEIKRGTTLRVQLEGNPKIEITDQARMSGQIRLKRGILEVQGKRFEIEKGTVSFVGDEPSNPQVMVTAGWTAPDGTRVYADFEGPLKTGKVKLRSEPPRPQNEILALIMFGTAEGSSATPYATPQPDGATRAGTTIGGFATEGLSKALDDLTGLEVSTKIDTSTSNPKPEIEVQIARDISLQIGYVLGTPPPGTNPDRTLLTIDWRFQRNWSMETTVGDQGSSILDFVWRYRY